METFFSLLTHVIIIGGFSLKIYLVLLAIIHESDRGERILRSVAVTTSLLIFFGARAIGMTIANLMLESLSMAQPFSLITLGGVLPSLTGVLLAWYVVRTLRKDVDIAIRVMIIIALFTTLQFAEAYLAALHQGFHVGVDFLPNLTFTISISLYAILTVRRGELRDFTPR